MNFYNDNDAKACAWLRQLVADGLIPAGTVEPRSILDLTGADVAGFQQVHLFAGIGGWALALRLAGWPEDREVWTASCPCQPFSVAGKAETVGDERHLWPAVHRLIAERRPPVIFGEQVASAAGRETRRSLSRPGESARSNGRRPSNESGRRSGGSLRLGNPDEAGRGEQRGPEPVRAQLQSVERGGDAGFWDTSHWLLCKDNLYRRIPLEPALFPLADGIPGRVGLLRGAGNAIVPPLAAEFIKAVMEANE